MRQSVTRSSLGLRPRRLLHLVWLHLLAMPVKSTPTESRLQHLLARPAHSLLCRLRP